MHPSIIHTLLFMAACVFVKERVAYFCIVSDFMSGLWRKRGFFCLQQLLRQSVSQFIRSAWQSVNQSVLALRNLMQLAFLYLENLNYDIQNLALCHHLYKIDSPYFCHTEFLSSVSYEGSKHSALSFSLMHSSSLTVLRPSFNIFFFETKLSQDHILLFECQVGQSMGRRLVVKAHYGMEMHTSI